MIRSAFYRWFYWCFQIRLAFYSNQITRNKQQSNHMISWHFVAYFSAQRKKKHSKKEFVIFDKINSLIPFKPIKKANRETVMRLNIPERERREKKNNCAPLTQNHDGHWYIFKMSTTKFNGIRIIYQEKLKNLLNLFCFSVRWPNILTISVK